ncbi:MAG: TonB-dependent receptor protein [Chthoniobacter sp.]|nr:TonB-dependent receptor protein [Chthoniobacter sp.]
MKKTFLTAAAAIVLGAPRLPAQERRPDTSRLLPEVVVTAHSERALTMPSIEMVRAELNTQPGGTAVVDAEQFKRGRATTLKDALDFAPGVFIQPRFGAEEARISIRGSGIQRTFHGRGIKLLQDGVPLNLADGSFDFQAVEPLATRSIEVYRGANALQFGATTLGGAINFVSLSGHQASPLQARFEYGSFESYHAQLSSGGVFGPFDHYLSLSHSSSDGFREHSQQNHQRLFANFGYRISPELETRFFITAVMTASELPGELTKQQLRDDPRQASRVPAALRSFQPVARFDKVTSNWKRDFELWRIANRTTWQSGVHRFSMNAFWAHKDLDHPILFVIDQVSNDLGMDLRYDNSSDLFGHKNRLTIGLAPTYGVTADNRFANDFGSRGARLSGQQQKAANWDAYLQERFHLTPSVSLVAGGQISYANRENDDHSAGLDRVDNSDTQDYWGYSPKLGVLWEITPEAQAFANVSRSFEPPSFGELSNAVNGGKGLVQLAAQAATTLEFGTRGRHGSVAWDLAYYYAWLDRELLELQVQPGLSQTVNADRTIHQGVEAALDVDVLSGMFTRGGEAIAIGDANGKQRVPRERKQDRLVLRQLYLWNNFHFDDDATFGDNQLPGLPEHYYRAELLYEHPSGIYGGPNAEWVPKRYNVDSAGTEFADTYALLGFKLGYRAWRGFSVFVEAKNLTNETYAATTSVVGTFSGQALFLPGDGRGFYGGLEWRW